MTTVRLTVQHGKLYFPKGGIDTDTCDNSESVPSMLILMYAAGDCDTCEWPMDDSDHEAVDRLQRALFDERESNPFFPTDAEIELPDGTLFNF